MSYLGSGIEYQDPWEIRRPTANCYICEGITLGTPLCETCAEDY